MATLLLPDVAADSTVSPSRKTSVWIVGVGFAGMVAVMLLVGTLLSHAGGIDRWDESVNRWFVGHRTDTWNRITEVATWLVDTVPAIGVAVIITAALAVMRRWREAAMLLLALALELAVFLSVTFVVDRPRPAVPRLNATPSTSSFPSGHTAAATVLFAGLAIIVTCCTASAATRIASYLLATFAATVVGFARVYRGMHHPTDVVAGALLGAACLVVATLAVRAWAPKPEPSTRRAGVPAESLARPSAA